jgi:putative transposase
MARKRYKLEEIVAKLRQVDVLVSQGQVMADAILSPPLWMARPSQLRW